MPVAAITLRSEKGSPLTHDEVDLNWSRLENFVNSLETLLGQITNADGTIKNNLVTTNSIVNRAITTLKRSFDSNFFYVNAGNQNELRLINPVGATMSSLPDGFAAYIALGAVANTGPCTIQVDGLAAAQLYKLGALALTAGDLPANSVIHVVAKTGAFYLLSVTPQQPAVTGIVTSQGTTNSTPITGSLLEVGTVTLTKPAGTLWNLIRIAFSTTVARALASVTGFEAQIGGSPVAGMVIFGNSQAQTENSDDNNNYHVITEGVPSGFAGNNAITFSIKIKKGASPYDANGDEITSRRLYAVGYYGPA